MNIDEILKIGIFQEYSIFAKEIGAINLAQGVPEPIVDDKVNALLAKAVSYGWAYTDTRGILPLREAVAKFYHNDFAIDEIVVTSGATESLYNAFQLAKEKYGHKIALIAPFFPYYASFCGAIGLEMVAVNMLVNQEELVLDFDELEKAFIAGARSLVLNTPHNPSGYVISVADAKKLRCLVDKYQVLLIIDEVYRHYVYDEEIDEIAAIKILYQDNPNVLLIGSASKFLSVTGMRIGWLIAPLSLLKIPNIFHLHTSYCQPAPLQHVVAELLNTRDQWFNKVKEHYQQKYEKLSEALEGFGFKCYKVSGGHFILARYDSLSDEADSDKFAKKFAREYGILPLATNIFYPPQANLPRTVRFSFTASMPLIDNVVIKLALTK